MPKPKSIRGMGIIADPYRGPAKKRGGKRPARPGWGQALLGRGRRGWSNGGALSSMKSDIAQFPEYKKEIRNIYKQRRQNILSGKSVRTPAPKRKTISTKKGGGGWASGGALSSMKSDIAAFPEYKKEIRNIYKQRRQNILSGKSVRTPAPKRTKVSTKKGGGGWSLGGALNSKRKEGYQGGGRTGFAPSTITAPKDQYGRTYGFRRGRFDPRVQSKAVQYARSLPPGGWNRGGPAKFRDDQSLGIRGGKVRKPVGYQSGRTVNPRAAGEAAMKRQRRMKWNNRTTPVPAGWGAYGSPFSSNARFPSPPGGWNTGGILEKVPVKKKKKVHPASVGGRGKRVRIKRVPSKRSKAKQKYLKKGRGG